MRDRFHRAVPTALLIGVLATGLLFPFLGLRGVACGCDETTCCRRSVAGDSPCCQREATWRCSACGSGTASLAVTLLVAGVLAPPPVLAAPRIAAPVHPRIVVLRSRIVAESWAPPPRFLAHPVVV
ncbi:MAG: hypothetical protein ACM3OB_09240 [Acidobacteriota bacterium]